MKEDADELDHMIRVDERLRRAPLPTEQIRRPTEAVPPVATVPADTPPHDIPVDGTNEEFADGPAASQPAEREDEEMSAADSYDDIPDAPNVDLDSEDDEPEGSRVRAREDADSDVGSVREAGHSPKKPRISALFGVAAPLESGSPACGELQALFRTSTVRKILDELNVKPEFQMPQKTRKGRTSWLSPGTPSVEKCTPRPG